MMRAPLAGVGLAILCALGAGTAAGQTPAVLDQPALISPRAAHSVLLGAATAGARLVAVGERGIVLLSDDHGGQWRQARRVPAAVTLTAVRFASATEGWAVGNLGLVLRSTDSGETWTRELDGARAAALMHDAAETLPPGEGRATALAAADQLVADGADKPFLDLAVSDDGVVAIGAYGLAARWTAAGGWRAASEFADPQGLHLYGLSVAKSWSLVAGEQGFLAVQHRGAPFEQVRGSSTGTFFGAVVLSDTIGLAFGLGGALARTDDAGEHWAAVESGITGAITCAARLPDGRVLLGGDSGEMSRGDADGLNFHAVAVAPRIPITAMLVDGDALIVTGPSGPRRLPLARLATSA